MFINLIVNATISMLEFALNR